MKAFYQTIPIVAVASISIGSIRAHSFLQRHFPPERRIALQLQCQDLFVAK
ncbi:MAG: hypothetical protein K2W99_00565 [Chthoniobacterales bacterium]|nr:hypothetical protein [Chthoniobacterales bacterium]